MAQVKFWNNFSDSSVTSSHLIKTLTGGMLITLSTTPTRHDTLNFKGLKWFYWIAFLLQVGLHIYGFAIIFFWLKWSKNDKNLDKTWDVLHDWDKTLLSSRDQTGDLDSYCWGWFSRARECKLPTVYGNMELELR